jgi:hypothetical protein
MRMSQGEKPFFGRRRYDIIKFIHRVSQAGWLTNLRAPVDGLSNRVTFVIGVWQRFAMYQDAFALFR